MSQLSNPHDKFFKATFSRPEIVTSFLEEYLPPAVVDALNLDTLELQKDSFIAPDLQEYFSDLLYREDIRGMALTQVGLLLLKYIYDPNMFEQIPSIFSLFKDLMKVQTAVEYLETALIYLSTTSEKFTSSDLKKAIEATKSRQGDRLMPTLAEQWREEGIEVGRIQNQRENILDFLLIRFDAAPPHIAEQIFKIENLDLLKDLYRQAITAESLSAFEAYLNSAVSNNPQ